MKTTKNGRALYMHCLLADISGVNCKEAKWIKAFWEIQETDVFGSGV